MKAYFNDPKLKAEFVGRMEAHIAADELRRGYVGEGGRGCAVWCTYDEYDHSLGPQRLGVPEWYELLRDGIFEHLPVEESQAWALASLTEVPVGGDVELIRRPFLIRMLRRLLGTLDEVEQARSAVTSVVEWLEAGEAHDVRARLLAVTRSATTEGDRLDAWWADAVWAAREVVAGVPDEAAWSAMQGRRRLGTVERGFQRDDLIDLLRKLGNGEELT